MYPPQGVSSRIVGGRDAEDGAVPYQCSLQTNKRHFCGCSVISKKWIVTASHCVDGQPIQYLEVFVGTNDLKNGGSYYKVQKFIMHEGYNQPMFANDIALIRLRDELQFNEKVQPIELGSDEVPDGVDLQLTGWGRVQVSSQFHCFCMVKL